MIKALIVGGVVIAVFGGVALIGGLMESKAYNKGYCTQCGHKLRFMDFDSQGGRGYTCDNCRHKVWVSWKWVDANHE